MFKTFLFRVKLDRATNLLSNLCILDSSHMITLLN
jgi:hypothetical protein